MHLLAVIALSAVAPFVSTLEPGAEGTQAPAVAPVAADAPVNAGAVRQPTITGAKSAAAAAPVNGSLSNLVAEAIKRKLEKAGANKGGGTVELPGGSAGAASPSDPAPMLSTPPGMPFGPGGSPNPSMMTGEARVMMGAPTDGSPSYVRVASQQAGAVQTTEPKAAGAKANPLAPSTDPMESGTDASPAAAEPGTNHNLLDIFVGTWDVSANFDNGPGQPPETASGQMTNSWQLDGRWLKQDYTGQMASLGAFRGLGYLGYDNLAKTYVATWMDTLSTSCLVSKGSFNEESATFTLSGDFTAQGGEKYKQKQVMTVLGPDRYTVAMYLTGPDGVEFKTGNLEYTRSVRAITSVSAK